MIDRWVLAGGSGFIGRAIAADLVAAGTEVVILSRCAQTIVAGAQTVTWDGRARGRWANALEGADAVINLSGRSVTCRHTRRNQREIMDSRVNSVAALGSAIEHVRRPPRVWIQAGAIGFYGDTGDRAVNEESPAGEGFLPEVCGHWEARFAAAKTPNTRRVLLRIGVVLGTDGGALKPLARLTRLGLGGAAGSGGQYVSWIHQADLVGILRWGVERSEAEGVYNAVSPGPVTNGTLMREMRRALGRPWSPPAPGWAVRAGGWAMGVDPSLVLQGQRVLPTRLMGTGFRFRYTQINKALADLLA